MSSSREDRGYQQYDDTGYHRGYGGRSDNRYRPTVNENGMQTIEDTVYITNLPQDVTEEKLAAHFGSIGIIKTDKKLRKPKIWIYLDKATNMPKGDATLTYDDPPSADAAIEWFGGKEFMGNIIQVSKAERKINMPAERGNHGYRSNNNNNNSNNSSNNNRSNNYRGNDSREGDWSCENCGVNNFSRRNECFKCHAQKQGGGRKPYSSSSSNSGRRDRNDRNDRGDRGDRGDRNDRNERRHDRRDRPY